MSANKTGLWVVDQRPMQVEQMMFTDEMNRELENLQDNKLKRVTIVGSRGIGRHYLLKPWQIFRGWCSKFQNSKILQFSIRKQLF